METPNYTFSQTELYTISESAWRMCVANINEFASHKPRYTVQYVATQLAVIADARGLSTTSSRRAKLALMRVRLVRTTAMNLINWQTLKTYILDAFGSDDVQAKLEEAGIEYYEKAADCNWEAVKDLLGTANLFIDHNRAALIANDNMPDGFVQVFSDASAECTAKIDLYHDEEAASLVKTAKKIAASNEVYKSLASLCRDGRLIFRDNYTYRNMFVIEKMLLLHGKGGTTGLKCLLKSAELGMPIDGVTVSEPTNRYKAVSGADGRIRIKRMVAGTYDFTFSKPGWGTVVKTIVFKPRYQRRMTVVMSEVAELAAVA